MNSPKIITSLGIDEIFVFGSNESGRHGKGTAKQAMQWGAVYGKGVGLAGKTYAIPTRKFVKGKVPTIGTPYYNATYNTSLVTLSLSEIWAHINNFIAFASVNPKLKFLLTPIACANAGYTPEQIAPMFKPAKDIENILLPESFTNIIKELV